MLERIKSWTTEHVRSVLESAFRVAVVSSTNPDKATVRVRIGDHGDLVSWDLRVLARKSSQDQDYWMPDIGDQVLCLFLPIGLEQGFVLGSFYSTTDPPPVQSQDKRHVLFKDGTTFEHDRSTHAAVLDMTGPNGTLTIKTGSTEVLIKPDHVFIRADRVDFNDDR